MTEYGIVWNDATGEAHSAKVLTAAAGVSLWEALAAQPEYSVRGYVVQGYSNATPISLHALRNAAQVETLRAAAHRVLSK